MKQAEIYLRVLWLNDNENLRPDNINIKLEGETTEKVVFSISKEDKNIGINAPWETNEWANGVTYNYQKEQQELEENDNQDEKTIEVSNIPYVVPSIMDNIVIQNYRKNIIKNTETEEYAYYTIKMTYIQPKPRKAKMMSVRSSYPNTIIKDINIENAICNKYKNGVIVSQIELDKVVFNDVTVFEKKSTSPIDVILANSTFNEGDPNFALTATTDEGVWSMEDDYGTSYYFRGAVENNYIKFGGFYWRIVRINGDGSLRIIYDGNQAYANGTNSTSRYALTNKVWNSKRDDAKYVGYMYSPSGTTASISKEEAQTNLIDSSMKTAVDNWYKANISGKEYEVYLSDNKFCNDRSIVSGSGYGKLTTDFGTYSRIYTSNNPSLVCLQKNDAFTVSDAEKGNSALTYPVGLITADEVVLAGGKFNTTNKDFYLYNPSTYTVTMTPCQVSSGSSSVFAISGGRLYSMFASGGDGVSPVINLKSDIQLSGSGTMEDPYELIETE